MTGSVREKAEGKTERGGTVTELLKADKTMRAMLASVAILVVGAISIGGARQAATSGAVVSGELKQWHKVTLTFNGPQATETDTSPNPFTDYRMTVVFTHESGSPRYEVPGYFAADGDAANSSAASGNKWRAQIARAPGGSNAMMPFYGKTPDEAVQHLSSWLTLNRRRTPPQV